MSSELKGKHTPGPWKAHKPERQFNPDSDVYEIHWSDIGECVAEVVHGEANAELFAEAGNVANETGLWPREMAEQRAELLEALRNLIEFRDSYNGVINIHADIAALDQLYAEARAAVAKAEGGTEQ